MTALRASRAIESFVHLFKGGGVQRQSLWPRSAERGIPLVLILAQDGVQGGTLAGGSPFFFASCVCADTLGGGRWPVLRFDPVSLVLAQRNGVEPPKKSAFLPWRLHYPRERYCFVDGMFLARLGEGAGGCLGRYPSPGANGIGDGRFARSVLLAGVTVVIGLRLPPKARFFGAPPRFFAQEQRNGVERAGPARSIAQ